MSKHRVLVTYTVTITVSAPDTDTAIMDAMEKAHEMIVSGDEKVKVQPAIL